MSPDTHHHDRAETLLDDYLMGTLSETDHAWMDEHMATCAICREEFSDLLDAMQALPYGAPEPPVALSGDVWNRIEASITTAAVPEVRAEPAPAPPPVVEMRRPPAALSSRWSAIAAALLVVLIAAVLVAQVVPSLFGNDDDSQSIEFAFTDPDISADGELKYLPEDRLFVLSVEGMPELPDGKVYQAWLIEGDKPPVPGGVMNPETGKLEMAGDREQFDTFAVTIEPGPEGGAAPTSDPVVVAPLHV